MKGYRFGAVLAVLALVAGCGGEKAFESTEVAHNGDAALGRAAFVQKGCVLCHSVNGVGGKAAPALDAADDFVKTDPLGFAARMWRGAPAMVEFQSVELGYVIDLSADDIANLAAFAASRTQQKLLKDSDIPEPMRDSILDERYWEMEDWSEFMANGQEGYATPAPDAAPSETPSETEPQ
ncbi:MAG: c-type cytochrome [Parvularculaceae bacterium]|nr:c-type cytochrome [Parvularculaceae bacterium]